MDLNRLFGLRPKAETTEELSAALVRAATEEADVAARIAALEKARGALLLDGTPEAVASGEAELTAARAQAERCAAIIALLRLRSREAAAADAKAAVDSAFAIAEEKSQGFANWFRDKYPVLAKSIAEGMAMEADALAAIERATQMNMASGGAGGERRAVVMPSHRVWSGIGSVHGIGSFVKLPHPDAADRPPLWPPTAVSFRSFFPHNR
jgi:hypothetical protein